MKTDNLIETLSDSITPEETVRIENRMLISAKIADAMKEKGWKKKCRKSKQQETEARHCRCYL